MQIWDWQSPSAIRETAVSIPPCDVLVIVRLEYPTLIVKLLPVKFPNLETTN